MDSGTCSEKNDIPGVLKLGRHNKAQPSSTRAESMMIVADQEQLMVRDVVQG
jgi:hypothetical protein